MDREADIEKFGLFILNADWQCVYVNDYAANVLDRTPDALLGKNVWAEFPAAMRNACYEQFHKSRKSGEEVHFEEYVKTTNQWLSVSAFPYGDNLHIVIRKREFAEISYLQDPNYFDKYIEHTQDLITLTTRDGIFRFVSPAITRLLGYEVEEFIGIYMLTYSHPEDVELLKAIFDSSSSVHQGILTCRFLQKKGGYVWLEMSYKWMLNEEGKRSRKVCIWRNVTERKLVEERFVQAQRLGQFGSFERDLSSDTITWSDEMYRIHGLDPASGMDLREARKQIVPDDREKVTQAFETAILTGLADVEYRIVRTDGALRYVKSQIERFNRDNSSLILRGFVHDITSHKEIEAELKRSNANLEIAQEIAGLAHYDWDVIRNELFWSDRLFDLLRIPRERFNNRIEGFMELVHPDETDRVKQMVRDALHGGTLDMVFRMVVGEQDVRIIHTMAKTTYDQWGRPLRIFGTVQDITVQKQTEELLRKSEKLNVAGQLAAGIAHEIRNPLTALKGFAKLMCHANEDTKQRYYLIMQEEFNRIEMILGELLILAKPQVMAYHPYEPMSILSEVIELLNTQAIMNNVVIEIDFESELPLVMCERNQIKQVFVNVIKNAIEAMPSGGNLQVTLRRTSTLVAFSFADQGVGISEERLPRIGEPFYTTKEKGTGLGMMVSFAIIEEHQGHIEYQSKVGVGTTVLIELPALNE